MRKLLILLAVLVFLVGFMVPASATLRAPPMMIAVDNMMMAPTTTANHQTFLTEAQIETIVDDVMMAPTNIGSHHQAFLAEMTEMRIDANYLPYHGGRICLPGAMITLNQNFAQEIVANYAGPTTTAGPTIIGPELTVIMAISAKFLNDTESTFNTAERKSGAAMVYNTNIYMPVARMSAMNNINRVTTIILRL